MQIVLGLTGYAGSGKDAAAAALVERGWVRVAFADAVREIALAVNPYIDRDRGDGCYLSNLIHRYGWEVAKKESDVRQLLQNLGIGAREVLGADVWVNVAAAKIDAALNAGKSVVVTDVRFPNEVEELVGFGSSSESGLIYQGCILRISRPGVGPVNGHVSESILDSIKPDYTIENDGSEDELRSKIVAVAEQLAL